MRAKALVAAAGISCGCVGFIGIHHHSPPDNGGIDAAPTLAVERYQPPEAPFTETECARFFASVEEADPQHKTIARAVLNQYGELGVILSRGVPKKEIPKAVKLVVMRTAADFPGEDLTVVAYAQVNPPLKIGTVRFDADTRAVTYTAALP